MKVLRTDLADLLAHEREALGYDGQCWGLCITLFDDAVLQLFGL